MKQLVRRTVDRLNRSEAGRIALYWTVLRLLSFYRRSVDSPGAALSWYKFYVRALAAWFRGELNGQQRSAKLAAECDRRFIEETHLLLESTRDVKRAKAMNKALHDFEHDKRLTRMASYPHRMYLELTDACNLKCPMCTQAVLTGVRKNMPMDVIGSVRHIFRYMDLISFVGCGETLVHPNFREVMEAVPNRTASTRIITNGILLTEETSRFLIEQGLDQLWVSLDATNERTFEIIRESKQFLPILDNVRTLLRLKRELGSERPHVGVNFVARRCNIEELPDFVRLAKELGAEEVNVGYLQVYTRDLVRESLFFHQELSDRLMLEAKRVADELGIRIYIPGLFSSTPEMTEEKARYDEKCVEPYKFVYVRAEGTLGPCCVNDSRLGSLHNVGFDDLWNGPDYREFRRKVNTPEEDLHCKHCMLEGYKDIHSINHHLKLIDENEHVEDVDYERVAQEVVGVA